MAWQESEVIIYIPSKIKLGDHIDLLDLIIGFLLDLDMLGLFRG